MHYFVDYSNLMQKVLYSYLVLAHYCFLIFPVSILAYQVIIIMIIIAAGPGYNRDILDYIV